MSRGSAVPGEETAVAISSSPSSSDTLKRTQSIGHKTTGGHTKRGNLSSNLRSSKKPKNYESNGDNVKVSDKVEEKEEENKREEVAMGRKEGGDYDDDDSVRVRGSNGTDGDVDAVFPVRRVKIIMTECEDCRCSQESVFLVNKAVELFLQTFVADAYKKGRKKSVTYQDLSSAVCTKKKYQFLSDYVPEKIKAEDALKARASLEF